MSGLDLRPAHARIHAERGIGTGGRAAGSKATEDHSVQPVERAALLLFWLAVSSCLPSLRPPHW